MSNVLVLNQFTVHGNTFDQILNKTLSWTFMEINDRYAIIIWNVI